MCNKKSSIKNKAKLALLLILLVSICTLTILFSSSTAHAYALQSFIISPDPSKMPLQAPGTYDFNLTVSLPGGSGSNPVYVYLSPTAGPIPGTTGMYISYGCNPIVIPAGGSSANTTMTLQFDATTESGNQTLGITAYDNPGNGGQIFGSFNGTLRINEFQLAVNSLNGYGNPYGAGWYIEGTNATFGVTQTSVQDSGVQYDFNGWSTNDSMNGYAGGDLSNTITMNSSIIETAQWAIGAYEVNFQQSGSYSNPIVNYQYQSNGSQVQSAAIVPFSIWVDPDSTITYSYDDIVSGNIGTQYVFTNASQTSPQTVNSPLNITGYYKTQYQLVATTNFGSANGSGWYDAGSFVSISATAPSDSSGEQYVWNGWIGTGSGSYNGSNNPTSEIDIQMNGPITESATWVLQYQVTFSQTGSDAAPMVTYQIDNGNIQSSAAPFNIWVNSGSTITYSYDSVISGSPGVQYILNEIAPFSPQTVNSALAITSNYQTYYWVTYGANISITTPSGEWVLSGKSATGLFVVDRLIVAGDTQYIFLGDNRSSSITEPSTIIGFYKVQYYLVVKSDYGNTGGQNWYDAGTVAYASIDNATASSSGTLYAFVNWTGDASGSNLISNPIIMDSSKTADANWTITPNSPSSSPTPTPSSTPTPTPNQMTTTTPTPSPSPTLTQKSQPTVTPTQAPTNTQPTPTPQPTILYTIAGSFLLLLALLLLTLLLLAKRRRKNNKNKQTQALKMNGLRNS